MKAKAFLFDLNGTIIDDMQYHVSAWQGIVNELGGKISTERMREECYGKNAELPERICLESVSLYRQPNYTSDP
jgi:beta-phosphoglucomutase